MLNLAHDLRKNLKQPHPSTNERVAWTSVRNLTPEISPVVAATIMTATANLATTRKLESGKPLRGRRSDRVVFQYSLSWHPTEDPSREEMEQAADETLDILGASNRQAMIFCHTHRQNSIIQLVVNRVDDQTGLMLRLYNSMVKLSQWARDWEIRHGTIFTPNRKISKIDGVTSSPSG